MAKANKDQDTPTNLETIGAANLTELSRTIDQQIGRREAERRQEALGKLRELASEHEPSIDELFELARVLKGKSVLLPRYRHPKIHDLTWTDLNRRPQWLVSYIGDGGALQELRI